MQFKKNDVRKQLLEQLEVSEETIRFLEGLNVPFLFEWCYLCAAEGMPEEKLKKTSEEAEKDSYSSYAGGSANVDYVQDNSEGYRSTPQYDDYDEKVKDSGSIGWGILGFFLPIVGLILFIAWHNSKPNSARAAGLGALISVIVNFILSIISFIVLGIGSALFFNDSGVNVDSYVEEFRAILQSLMA